MALFSTRNSSSVWVLAFLGAAGAALSAQACGGDDGGSSETSGTPTSTTSSQGGAGPSTGGNGNTGGDGGSTSSNSGGGGGGVGGGSSQVDCGLEAQGPVPDLQLTPISTNLDRPVFVTAAPGDNERLFVVEQEGRVRVIVNGVLQGAPFIDISALTDQPGQVDEFGLLSMVFHPDYATNGRFFLFYSDSDASVVSEFARSANDPNVASPGVVQTILNFPGAVGQHYGAMMAFAEDGYLFVSSGDRGDSSTSQDIDDIHGKLLRLDVDDVDTAPPGNLPGGHPLVWNYGLRNSWRFSIDRCTQDLYISDVGGNWEEVNIEPPNTGHRNYGWPIADQGTECTTGTCAVVAHNHNSGDCSIVGGYVYRGTGIPNMNGRYIYGDSCSLRIRSFRWGGGDTVALEEELTDNLNSDGTLQYMTSFGEDNVGNLYVLDLAGGLYRIDAQQ
ncbi:PQQ-dependent sugar dehydrogenase [Chondromyces apiculatus]|nr:PQQ-dependent sugar dehydrogenase [Chondromyces apiculatus]